MDDLKPCPFCGGDEFWLSTDACIWPTHMEDRLEDLAEAYGWDHVPTYVTTSELQCKKCGCALQAAAYGDDLDADYHRAAQRNVVSLWNERATDCDGEPRSYGSEDVRRAFRDMMAQLGYGTD